MRPWLDINSYSSEEYRESLQQKLAELLRRGELCLFLGAGCNAEFGLPNWFDLTVKCLKEAGLEYDDITNNCSNGELLAKMEEVGSTFTDPEDYHNLVRDCLYDKVELSPNQFLGHHLLSSLGAMMMGSKRGSIKDVVTLNFDNILEMYLNLHGFVAESVYEHPRLLPDADVMIYHPHGYLPMPGMPNEHNSNFLILDQHSYDERATSHWEPWKEVIRRLAQSKIFIAIGMSGSDPLMRSILTNVAESTSKEWPIGFWMLGPCPDNNDTTVDDQLKKRNIVPLRFNDFSEYPAFLLGVCQLAAST